MLVQHRFAFCPVLPSFGPALYEYVVAANGIFVRAERAGLKVLIPVVLSLETIRGLVEIEPFVEVAAKVPAPILDEIFARSLAAAPQEILFYLLPGSAPNPPWRLITPEQAQSLTRVRPVQAVSAESAGALIEVHSHHYMRPAFSSIDDEDETGFRLYAVLGDLPHRPAIRMRVGVYGHFWEIPADCAFDLPAGIEDALSQEARNGA
jgi:PRTRC genetic system protein A